MNRLIIFLIRKRLKLKKGEFFQFANQKSKHDYYYFTAKRLVKIAYNKNFMSPRVRLSGASLNWLVDKDCKIRRFEKWQVI